MTIKHGLYAENFRRPFLSLSPLFRDICDQEMAGARCRFPRRVKRLTVKLIESFKVIGIDNGEVNKSHHHPASSPTPPLKGCSVEGRGGLKERPCLRGSRERERGRRLEGERTFSVLSYSSPSSLPPPILYIPGKRRRGRLGPL